MENLINPPLDTQITYETLRKGEKLYNDVLNNESKISNFTLSELIPFIAYNYYMMGLEDSLKGGK